MYYLLCFRYVVIGWCHLITFIRKASQFLSQWYNICLLTDCTALHCLSPHYRVLVCSTWKSRVITVCAALLALVVFLNISLTADLFYVGARPICTTHQDFITVLFHLERADVGINVLIPVLLVVLCVVRLVVRKFCEGKSQQQEEEEEEEEEMQQQQQQQQQRSGQERISTKDSFLLYCILHLTLWLPLQVLRLINAVTLLVTGAAQLTLRAFLWEQLAMFINYTNMAFNLLFLIVGHAGVRRCIAEKTCLVHGWIYYAVTGQRDPATEERSSGNLHTTTIEILSPSDDELENKE